MRCRLFIVYVVLIPMFLSCVNKHDAKHEEIMLNGKDETEITTDDLFQTVEVIHLDSVLQGIIKDVKKIEYYQNKYYMLDTEGQKCVTVFDNKGKYVSSIGKTGKGRGEYINAYDFAIDRENERVIILSDNSNVYVYDLNGDFINSKQMTQSLLWSVASNNKGLLFTTNHLTYTEGKDAQLFYFFDKELSLKHNHTSVLPKQMAFPTTVKLPLSNRGNDFYYIDTYTNTCYLLNQEGVITKVYDFKIPNEMPYEMYSEANTFAENQMKYDRIQECYIMGNSVITYYLANDNLRVNVTNLEHGQVLDNVFLGLIPCAYAVTDDEIISAYNAETLLSVADDGKGQTKLEPNPNDNFTIIKYKLRPETSNAVHKK